MDLQGSVIQDSNAVAELRAATATQVVGRGNPAFEQCSNQSTHLDELIILQPGDLRLRVAEGNAGQHRFRLHQQSKVGRMAFDLWL